MNPEGMREEPLGGGGRGGGVKTRGGGVQMRMADSPIIYICPAMSGVSPPSTDMTSDQEAVVVAVDSVDRQRHELPQTVASESSKGCNQRLISSIIIYLFTTTPWLWVIIISLPPVKKFVFLQ